MQPFTLEDSTHFEKRESRERGFATDFRSIIDSPLPKLKDGDVGDANKKLPLEMSAFLSLWGRIRVILLPNLILIWLYIQNVIMAEIPY